MKKLSQKAQETKRRIMTSAQKLFHKKGFEATSVREITEAAGCAKGTFYLYFETKLDLLTEISKNLFTEINNIITKELSTMTDDPFSQIDQLFEEFLIYAQKADLSLIRFTHTSEVMGLMDEAKITETYFNVIISKISQFLSRGIERGFFRQINPTTYAKMLYGFVHQSFEDSLLEGNPDSIENLKSELSFILRRILEK